jgi:hypothetical protein
VNVKKSLMGCLLLCLGLAARGEAQTFTLQAVADSTLKQSPANKNRGSDLTLQLAGDGRVLVRFDQDAIAAAVGSGRLVSASLELFVHSTTGSWGPDGRPIEAHLVTAGWTEAGVTWNCATDTNPANNKPDCASPWSGGSFADDATDSVVQTSTESVWVPFDVTADVAAFLGGTPNQGWLIVKADGDQSGKADYGSREGTAAERPQLVLLVESAAHDEVPPSLVITSPSQPILVNDPAPAIVVEYSDGGSGVDLGSLQVLMDGQDVTPGCTSGPQSASCHAPTLAAGNHTVQAQLRDHAGNAAQASAAFQLLLGPGPHVVTLQTVGDTYLRKGDANKNFGSEPILRVRESGPQRALVQFDGVSLANTLSGATVVSASLELHIEKNGRNWGKTGRTVDAHRLTSAWTEAGATWNCPNDSNTTNGNPDCAAQWAGGSFAATPTSSVLHTKDLTGWVRYDVTADVTAFASGSLDFGWLLKKTDETKSGLVEYDSQQGTTGAGPRLVVVFTTPTPGDTTPPSVAITSPANNSLISTPTVTVQGTASDDVAIASLKVNGLEVAVTNGVFQTTVDLAEGSNSIFAIATDSSGNQSTAAIVVTLDSTPPTLTVDSPIPGQSTNQVNIEVTGSATDLSGIGSLAVNGTSVALTGDRFDTVVELTEGGNTLTIAATDTAGNHSETTVSLSRFSLPAVTITSPADLSYLAATTVDVSGTIDGPVTSVTVNGVNAQVSETSFVARDVPLLEGGNILTVAATDARGHVGTASINVVRDLTAPRITIDGPVDGARLLDPTVTVSGLVNDIVDGTVNASEATVTVNGWPATVANRSYAVEVPLTLGDNALTAVAVDRSGNVGQASVIVHLDPAGAPRLAIVSGDHQQAVIGTFVPIPLIAVLLDAGGQPVAGKQVIFKVSGNDGSLDGGKREIAVLTGSDGRVSAQFKVGTRVGAGNQVVEASAVGFRGPAVFRATGLPASPALLVVDSGNQQVGVAGQALPRPLVAVVIDTGYNRLPGVPVRFKVTKGKGHFADGSQDLVITSDSDGRAIVPWVLDPQEGIANNVVEARIDGLPDGPLAAFIATGWVAGDAAQTSISGVILDNSGMPVPGVTARIRDTALTAQTDVQGLFRIAAAPVGTVKLIVDGSTAQRLGSWPDLEFVLTTIPGRDNTLGMPIYLLPLDLTSGLLIDETHGGTLTLPDVPGFALEILPGSVTFPGGGKSGVVSVTVVHDDKVPMVPNFGQQPRLIVTIQPAGARFEPPARLTLPNVEGFAPGQVAEMYSFDHDLGHFVSIGPATVSEDGSVVSSNHGVGIVKAGWHCCGFPKDSGTPNHCPECTKCTGDDCLPEKLCQHCGTDPQWKACDGEGQCRTGQALIPKICGGLGVEEQPPGFAPCSQVPDNQAYSGFCNVQAIAITYSSVTHHCDNVDLRGGNLDEEMTTDNGCGGLGRIIKGSCAIVTGNRLAPPGSRCRDYYWVCPFADDVPDNSSCTEVLTQKIMLDNCSVRTRKMVVKITKHNNQCSGTATLP